MPVALALFKIATAVAQLIATDPAASFQQRHLGGQMVPLQQFDLPLLGVAETDVINAPIPAGAMQPDVVHGGGPDDELILASAARRCEVLRG